MMKSRLSLRNSARAVLNLFLVTCFVCGCSSSTLPTYRKANIETAIQDICKNEYQIDVKVTHIGQTVWVYMPVEDLLVKLEKPEKYSDKFEIKDNQVQFSFGRLEAKYMIKDIPQEEKTQEYKYNKDVLGKINNVWKVLRRVLFSMERSEEKGPKFFCLVTADIKNGFETTEIFYYLDLKKVSYDFISWTEYQHRAVDETAVSIEIIGDKEGRHLNYRDITLDEFVARQIQHRIKLKFQKPEVDQNIDIDKEILKIVIYTIKTYEFKDFTAVQLDNLFTHKKIFLNQAALLRGSTE